MANAGPPTMQPPAIKKPRSGAARGQTVRQPSSRSRRGGDHSASDEGERRHRRLYDRGAAACQCSSSGGDLEVIPAGCEIRARQDLAMTAATAARLYDEDFFLWTQEQSRLLRDAAERRLNFP